MKSVKETGALILVLLALAHAVTFVLDGCLPKEAKEALAETTYLAQQLECVDNLHTKEDIDGCRDSVKRRWDASVSDAGSEGGDR